MTAPLFHSEPNENEELSWDTPVEPPKHSLAVVYKNNVVLVRHFFSDTGDIQNLFNDYISNKF